MIHRLVFVVLLLSALGGCVVVPHTYEHHPHWHDRGWHDRDWHDDGRWHSYDDRGWRR